MSPDAQEVGPLRAMQREMLRIRRLEEASAEQYAAGRIRGFLHLCIGEEAIPAGVVPALTPADAVVATYREHGHALARGVPMGAILAEMFGKQEGCSRGRGGSMHLFDVGRRFYGGNAIVGGGLPLAVGLALADRTLGRAALAACFFGEGAVAEGAFHESMNLAALWRLPVAFICENNLYAMGTRLELSEAQPDLLQKARACGVPAERVDGMDVRAVRAWAERVLPGLRAGGGPCFVEMATYRFRPHSMFDPELYRSKDEIARWRQQDPLVRIAASLTAAGAHDPAADASLELEVAREVEEALAYAAAGTDEPVADLLRDVTAGGHA